MQVTQHIYANDSICLIQITLRIDLRKKRSVVSATKKAQA